VTSPRLHPLATEPGEKCVLVVCVGNTLAADDAVGPAVYENLVSGPLPAGVRVELLAVGGVRLLDELQGERALVVVDAVSFGAAPGTVHVLPWERIPENAQSPVTCHGIGIRETIEVGRILFADRMPARVLLIGVEGRRFDDLGGPMTPEVAAAVGPAADAVRSSIPALPSGQPALHLPDAEESLPLRHVSRNPAVILP